MRVVGIETEYGIVDPAEGRANPILLSSRLVVACRKWAGEKASRWDYGGEDPLQDLRGFRRSRAQAHPTQLTDTPGLNEATGLVTRRRRRGSWEDPAHVNVVLANGSRFYVDHAHPEYSGPEVTSARDAVIWDQAGDRITLAAAQQYAAEEDGTVHLYKNNVDGKGASYGTHENFLLRRDIDFDDVARYLTAHLVTRQVFAGTGRVGLGPYGDDSGFQISQRADYMEAEVGLETTLRRPIINTRDEPHADPREWRRLHVIIGDANVFQVPTYLKVGSTSLILSAIEAQDDRLEALVLKDPVEAVYQVSRDLSLRSTLDLASGEQATALQIQQALITIARTYVQDEDDARVVEKWERVIGLLSTDMFLASADVEWVAKLQLLGRMRSRYAVDGELPGWSDPRLQAADISWSRLGDGLATKLIAAGQVSRVVEESEIAAAVHNPPRSTRAWLRGRMVAERPDIVDAAGWSSVVLDRDTDHGDLEVVHLLDPMQTTDPLLDSLLEN